MEIMGPVNPALLGLAANPSLTPALIDRLIASGHEELDWVLSDRRDLSPAQAAALAARSEALTAHLAVAGQLSADDVDPEQHPEATLALLARGAAPTAWAGIIACSADPRLRERLAECPALPEDVADTLAADPEVQVVAELALWTTADRAARLARHPHAQVRQFAAANEATSPDVLAALLTGEGLPPAASCLVCDREPVPFIHPADCARLDCDLPPGASCDGSHESAGHAITWHALGNPSTPAAAAARLAGDPSPFLRRALAERADLPLDAARRLAADPVPGVRETVAGNPSADGELLRKLAADPSPDVRRQAAHHPAVPLDVLAELARSTRIGPVLLPRVAAASRAEISGLARSADPVLRMLTAQRRDLPDQIRDELARDPDAKVLASVAPHPGLPEARLLAMVDQHGPRVAAQAAANPDATPAILARIAQNQPAARKALRVIARHPHAPGPALLACLDDRRAGRIAASHPNLPVPSLLDLLSSDDPDLVEAAAANPSLPGDVMADLIP